ncbi:hypothetical protein [Lutispora sp.]|uniref:hypothetical protein n=1 Tax=Lutispora sp. TaxID=2828727 RepID=UPI00356679CF
MPTWTSINADTFKDFQIAFNRYMEYFVSHLSSKNVKRLDTNETEIKSKDGTTYINGPLLEMRDAALTMRLRQGYDKTTGKFVYQLFDESGDITIDLDSNGEATFKGNIETLKNAFVGNDLYLGSTGSVTKALRFRSSTKDIVFRGYVDNGVANIGIGLLDKTDASNAAMDSMNGNMFIYGSMVLMSGGTSNNGNLIVDGKFGCNGANAQESYSVNGEAAEDLAEVTELVNQLRQALINNGVCA